MTELCDGTLHDLVVVNKDYYYSKLTSNNQLRDVVLRQIVEGLKHLHDNGILHRGLTPRNILYRTHPLVMKLADFGCSRSLPQDATHYTRTVSARGYSKRLRPFGTDGWLAPEVLNGETHLRPPHVIDIYPLGLIFAFTLCGECHPYGDDATARDERIKNKKPMLDVIRQQLMELGDECYDLINRMLDPNPEKRPTAAEVLKNETFFPPRPIWNSKVCITKIHYYYCFLLLLYLLMLIISFILVDIAIIYWYIKRMRSCWICAALRDWKTIT